MRATKVFTDGGRRYRLEVDAILHQIGGQSPHFSITGQLWRANASGERDGRFACWESGGCIHDEILRHFPQFADLVALHLSNIDGKPMHAEANGWYWLAGELGGMGERYHGGNRETYGKPNDCLGIFAKHCRVSIEEARDIARDVVAWSHDPKACRERWAHFCRQMEPRWLAEANAAIAKYDLKVKRS